MAHIRADRVQETSTFTGTGAVTLGTVPARMRAFNTVMANGDTAFVLIEHATAAEVEICLATWNTGNSLTRGAVISSSTGSRINFSAGTKTISIVAVAARLVVEDENGDADVERDFEVGRDLEIVRNAEIGEDLDVGGRVTLEDALDEAQASNMASASSMDIAAANGNYIVITGTTAITAFTTAMAGVRRKLKFAGILTLTHDGTSFINLTGANITTAAGDIAEFVSEGSGHWRMTGYERASGAPLILTSGLVTAALGYTPENAANRGAANGYASLGSDGLIPTAQLPALAITDVFPVASQAAMLALTAQKGDIAVRSDVGKSYILSTNSPSTLADWLEMTAIGAVTSVAGRIGAVVITSSDLADFATAVRTNRLDQLAAPAADVAMGGYKITGLGTPVSSGDATTKGYVDTAVAAIPALPGKNRLINGDMAIDQRNEGSAQTFTAAAAVAYCIDRWYASCTGANITGQRVAGTSPNQFAYRLTGAASVTGVLFGQRIEAANIADLVSADVAVSLKVKSSSLTSLTWTAYYANAADDFSAKTQIATGTISSISSTLAAKSFTFNAGANAANGICIEFTGGALLATHTLQIEVVQLESGTTATAFERRLYSERLAACRRYLPAFKATATSEFIAHGHAINATSAFLWYQFDVEARIPPTGVTASSAGHFACTTADLTQKTCSVVATGGGQSKRGILIDADSATSGLTAGDGSHLVAINSAAKLFFTGAEL